MKKIILTAAIVSVATLNLHAADLFQVSATTADGSVAPLTVNGNNLLDLVQNAVKSKDQFAAFQNKDASASVTYAGVANAIQLHTNADNTVASIKLSDGFTKTFNGASRNDLEQQITDFLKKDGSTEYANLQKTVNQQSSVAVTDGNPTSATAKTALAIYRNYGTLPAPQSIERKNPSDYALVGDIGTFRTGGFTGQTYFLPIAMDFRLCENVRLAFDIPLSYTSVESAKIYNAGLTLSLPVRLINASGEGATASKDGKSGEEQPWTWQITPTGGGIAAGSMEFVSGGLLGYAALTNLVGYNFPYFTLSMGNQISFFEGQSISFGGYTLDTKTTQKLLKNGLQASVPIGDQCQVNIYGTYSQYLDTAAISSWFTVGIDFGVRPFSFSSTMLKVGYYTERGSDFSSEVGRVGLAWRF